MKAITLTQPWSSMVAIGAKKIETRSWRTTYRGLIAIHAAKSFPLSAQEVAEDNLDWYRTELKEAGIESIEQFPLGKIVAVANLRNCIPAEEAFPRITVDESWLGDYSPGRWAWVLSDVHRMITEVAAKGSLGLWTWKPGPDWERALGLEK